MENKIDLMLKNIKDNLSSEEMVMLTDKLNDIKFNVIQLKQLPEFELSPQDQQIVAEGMLELGYPLEDVREFLKAEDKD